jgi:hypothetical protein
MKLRYRRTIASLLVVSMTACAGPRQLAVGDRRSLPSQPRVYAVHHSPAAAFVVLGSPRLPQEMQAEDPAPRVKARLVGALKANLMLSNVRLVSDAPQGDEVSTLKSIFETGVVLDVRTMKWGLSDAGPHSFDSEGSITPGHRARAHYWGRARMINLEDSTVLWEATCSVQSSDRPGSFEAKLLEAADRCAAQFWPKALGRRHKPVSVSGHPTPAAGLPTAPRIVVDENCRLLRRNNCRNEITDEDV